MGENFLEAGGVVREVTCGFTQRVPQEIGTKISRAIYASLPVSCSKRWLVRGTTVKEVLEMCGCNSRRSVSRRFSPPENN